MTGPTRTRIRRRRCLTATTVAVVGAQLALILTAGATTSFTWSGATAAASAGNGSTPTSRSSSARDTQAGQHGTATMTVEVSGLPRHVRANVKLTGPGKKSRRITTTTKLKGVAAGTYTVSAQAVAWLASTYHPTITLCSASSRCSSPSHGRIIVKAHQRVTVHVAYAVLKPVNPQSSPSPGGSSQPSAEGKGTLASKGSESGIWAATISEPSGAPQTQAYGVISLPIPLKVEEGLEYKFTYRPESESTTPKPPCLGSPVEPTAEAGNFCVYRGGNRGTKEMEDKNAKEIEFQDALGNYIANGGEGEGHSGHTGVLVLFRTGQFSETGTEVTLTAPARLNAAGSWAVTAR
jgi:hypothetical protein